MLNDAPISWWPYVPLLIYTRILQKNQTEELNPLWKYTVISMSQCVGREGKGREMKMFYWLISYLMLSNLRNIVYDGVKI